MKWFGYKETKSDIAQRRNRLVTDGFGELCDYVDAFKECEAEAQEEKRTFRQFKAIRTV